MDWPGADWQAAVTIYVDNAMIPARVGRHRARWCHLLSDQLDPRELHEFAQRIGLKRSWFQPGRTSPGPLAKPDPVTDHYDVTEGMRARAVAAGAVEVDLRGASEVLRRKRAVWKALRAEETTHATAAAPTPPTTSTPETP